MAAEFSSLRSMIVVGASALLLTGCGSAKQEKSVRGAPKGPPEVGYIVIQPSSVPLVTELAGRTAAYQSSEVRPQVTGLIRRRFFTEGALVRQGQPLYQIDPSLYRASAN